MTDAVRPNEDACPQPDTSEARTARIRAGNDLLRTSLTGGRTVITDGIASLDAGLVTAILTRVKTFSDFTTDNDPHGEHDLGIFTEAGERVMWKIDYYDRTLRYGSPDPANPAVTVRVLTILLASEY